MALEGDNIRAWDSQVVWLSNQNTASKEGILSSRDDASTDTKTEPMASRRWQKTEKALFSLLRPWRAEELCSSVLRQTGLSRHLPSLPQLALDVLPPPHSV